MDKLEFVTSCCGRPIEDCPGCPQGMRLILKDEYMTNAKNIGEQIGIKWEDVSFTASQFQKGLDAEMKEHHDDPETKVIDNSEEAGKVAWAHLKEDGKYYDKLAKMEESKHVIFTKIEEGTVTADDFNKLIQEATPESVRDRLRRRQSHTQDTVRSHQDENGHADLSLPVMADRVQPKRKRADRTQMQHGGKAGHRRSARTQKRTMSKSLKEAFGFFKGNIGRPIDQKLLAGVEDLSTIHAVAIKLMSKPGINRDWLSNFCNSLSESSSILEMPLHSYHYDNREASTPQSGLRDGHSRTVKNPNYEKALIKFMKRFPGPDWIVLIPSHREMLGWRNKSECVEYLLSQNVPQEDISKSIIFVHEGNDAIDTLTPWILIHNFAHAIDLDGKSHVVYPLLGYDELAPTSDELEDPEGRFQEQSDSDIEDVWYPGDQRQNDAQRAERNLDIDMVVDAVKADLKFRSAQQPIDSDELVCEMFVDFMKHGGKIRSKNGIDYSKVEEYFHRTLMSHQGEVVMYEGPEGFK